MMYRYLAVLSIMLLAGSAGADDWPNFRGPDHNGISKETGLMKSWPEGGPKTLWTAPLGIGYSSMAVASGRVFTLYQDGTGQYAVAFNEKTGDLLWKTQTGPIYRDIEGWHGPRATPTVEGNLVWVNDGNSNVVCMNVADGKVIWKKNIMRIADNVAPPDRWWGMAQSPFIYKDIVVFNPGGNGAAFMALNKKTGDIVWKSGSDFPGYCTPVVSRAGGVEHLVWVDGTNAVGINPADGKILWTYLWDSLNHLNGVSPIAWDDKVFISGGYGHGAQVLKLDMKAPKPASQVWQSRVIQCHFQLPIKIDNCIYGYRMETLVCVDTDGRLKWDDEDTMPSKAQMTYADGLFYVLGEKGTLALAKMTPEGCQKLGEMEISPGESRWAAPVVANGRLYIRDDEKLYCLDIKAK